MSVGANGDNGSFHLPVPGLFADYEAGEGSVALTDDFMSLALQPQLAILADWRADLLRLSNRLLVDQFRAFSAVREDVPLPARIDQFATYCQTLKTDLPADFALLLQQH